MAHQHTRTPAPLPARAPTARPARAAPATPRSGWRSACACGGDCPRCRPLQVSTPGDALEREADAMAAAALSGEAAPRPPASAPAAPGTAYRSEEASARAGMALAGLDDGEFLTPEDRWRTFVDQAASFGLPVGFMRRVGIERDVVLGSSSYYNRVLNWLSVERDDLDAATTMTLGESIGGAPELSTLYHEAAHAFLDLVGDEEPYASFIADGVAHYEGAETTEGAPTTDAERVFHEAAATYVGHRAATWWGTLDMLAVLLAEPRVTRDFLERQRSRYDQAMARRVFGYSDEGGVAGFGSEQTETTRAMTEDMKAFLDHHLLEDLIPDRFDDSPTLRALYHAVEATVVRTELEEGTEAGAGDVARQATDGGTCAVPAGTQVWQPSAAQGQPMQPALRHDMEARFGHDFSGVRLHLGPPAAQAAAALHARAYTLGDDIVFGQGQWQPGSHAGRQLIAHELAHVVQQGRPGVAPAARRAPYTTVAEQLDRTSSAALAASDYWTFRTGQRYDLTFDPRMTADPEERDAVLAVFWAGSPPATVTTRRVVDVRVASRTVGTSTRPALHYRVTLEPPAEADALPGLSATFVAELGAAATGSVAPPAGYASRGAAPVFELEQLRGRRADPLGNVALPTGIPADEVAPVQHAVAEYFDHGGVRNSEVDAVIPVGTASRSVLYTLVFGAGNDVTVTRIGETGTGTGRVDRDRIDVTRVRGYPGSGAAPSALQSWWGQRYAGAPAPRLGASPTGAEVEAEMNRLIGAGIASAAWFGTVYGITFGTATALETRLSGTHGVPATLLTDCQDPDAADLRRLELALQTLSTSELQRLRGLFVGRKATAFSGSTAANGTVTWGNAAPGQFGLTLHHGSDVTVVCFGNLAEADAHQFRGSGAANALSDSVGRMLHELGHAGAHQAGIEAAFNAWFQARRQVAPTWYAATATEEIFPEAYMLYHTDPHFLCASAPQVYAWIDQWASTGTAPAGTAALTPPANCPP